MKKIFLQYQFLIGLIAAALIVSGCSKEVVEEEPVARKDYLEKLEKIRKEACGEKPEEHPRPARYDLPVDKRRELQGSYAAFGSLAEVKLKGNHLKAGIGGVSLHLVPLSDTEFAVTHWMEKTGLTRIIQPPVDFTKIRISFREDGTDGSRTMILNMMDISYEICPGYPVQKGDPEQWRRLCGSYRRADRIPGGRWESLSEGRTEIRMEAGILTMSGPYGPIVPVNDTLIRVLSGAYHGEYLDYVPATGEILHQKWAFIPMSH